MIRGRLVSPTVNQTAAYRPPRPNSLGAVMALEIDVVPLLTSPYIEPTPT
jgi:hypothetical protein